jgi:hypothetical protein
VRNEEAESMHFALGNNSVARESRTEVMDLGVDSELEIRTGLLQGGSAIDRTELIEIQLEYECEETQQLLFEYTLNGGITWNNYSQIQVQPTIGPTVLGVRRTLTHHNLQVRLRSLTLGKLTILAMIVFAVKGVRVNP